jgi:hypothetical protein
MQELLANFPYGKYKGIERVQVESILMQVASAHDLCVRGGDYGGDEEELIDDMFDILKPSEDDELLYLRVIDTFLAML